MTTPYRTAPDVETDDAPPPWWVRHFGAMLFVCAVVVIAADINVISRRNEAEAHEAHAARGAKHGATLAKLRRMTWPEMLRVSP